MLLRHECFFDAFQIVGWVCEILPLHVVDLFLHFLGNVSLDRIALLERVALFIERRVYDRLICVLFVPPKLVNLQLLQNENEQLFENCWLWRPRL